MYQPLRTDGLVSPANDGEGRGVPVGAYSGPERRRGAPTSPFSAITPLMVFGWVRRMWMLVATLALLGAFVGLGAGTLIKPRFTSYSDIMLDPSSLQVIADDLYARNLQSDAQLLDVESKMRVLTSANVLARVVADLGLENDADLLEPEIPLLDALRSSGRASEDNAIAAMRALAERIRVRRGERSYVVTASVWARTPEHSALLTNALVSAFLAELAQAESAGALNASTALNERLAELRDEAAEAEAAVAAYRQLHGLQLAGSDQLSTQSAVQINAQIDTARQAVIAAEARHDALTAGGAAERLSAATQESTLLANLRTEFATTRQSVDSLSVMYGPRHPTLATARMQLDVLQDEIDREVNRIVALARSDLDRARAVLDQLTLAAGEQRGAVFNDGTAQLELRQLERSAASKVAIYEAYLNRALEITERSQLNTSNVRVISPAIAPISRSFPPRTVLLAGAGLVAGLALGIALVAAINLLALMRPARRRSPAQAHAS